MEGVWRHLPVYAYDHYYGAYTQHYLPENIARVGYYFLQGYMIYCLLDPVDCRYHAGGQVFYPYHNRNQIEQPATSHEISTQEEEENDGNHDQEDDNADGDDQDEDDYDDDFSHLDEEIDDDHGEDQYALWEDISVDETLDEEEILMWDVDHDEDFDVDLSEENIDRCLKLRFPEGDEEEICVVCQDCLLQEEEKIATLDCGHEYHGGCIKKWLMHKNCCPLCKATAISNKVC